MSEMLMPCGRKVRRLARAVCLPTVALFLCLLPSVNAQSPPLADPLPLRRVLISPERLPAELQRAGQGVLVPMSRAEFEARVAEAAQAALALRNPPRLVAAHYQASLVDTALVGTAQWIIANPGHAAGVLPLEPFNLALQQVQFNKGRAVLGDLDGKLGLWVDGAGTRPLSMSWSARGDLGPAGLRFELKLPTCVLTTIDLELPADRAALIGDNALLSGPLPASRADRRLWRLHCSGASPIDLLIRQTAAARALPPLVLARLKTTQKLAPDRLEADYEFNLEVLHGGIRELWCEGDPALHPTSVSIGSTEIETWEVRPGPKPGAPFQLWIGLRERFQGSFLPLRIHCFASAAPTERWISPALRLKDAVFQGESLQLKLGPEMRLEDWQRGDFELTKAVAEGDGRQTLFLESGLAEALRSEGGAASTERRAPRRRRPSARLRVQEPEYRALQMAWWQIGPDNSSLTVQIDYEMVRGRLFRLPVLVPADWSPDRVELSPPDLLRNWTTMPSAHGQTLLIAELQRPLEMPLTARLTLQLRPVKMWHDSSPRKKTKPADFSMSFPEVLPQGARLWEGALAIRIDPRYEATIQATMPAAASVKRGDDSGATSVVSGDPQTSALRPLASILRSFPSPWGTQQADYLYAFHGQGVSGRLGLRLRSPRVRARCTSEIVLTSGHAAVLTRLLLQPEVGNPNTIDLLVSAPVTGKWKWRCESGRNEVTAVQRLRSAEMLTPLLSLGASTPLSAAGLFQPLFGRSSCWRLILAQPLREPILLETTFDLVNGSAAVDPVAALSPLGGSTVLESLALWVGGSAAAASEQQAERWEVPLLGVLSAQPMDGEVQLYLAGTGRVDNIERDGLTEVATTPAAGVSIPWHTFRYSHLPVSLVLLGRITTPEHPAAARVEQAHLTTYVEPAGRLLNYFTFRIRNWKQRILPLQLPGGARLLATKLNGRWLAPLRRDETTPDAPVVQLPVAADSPVQRFEVVYALDFPAGTLWNQVQAPLPGLPVSAVASSRTWCLPAGWMPLYEGRFQRRPGPNPDSGESGLGMARGVPWFADPAAPFSSDEWRHRQERLLAEADTFLQARRRENNQRSLGQALHDWIYYCFKDQEVLVLDAVALREAGLWPATPIRNSGHHGTERRPNAADGSPPRAWEDLGLVCIPCRPAPLLTTQRQWAAWQGTLGRTDSVSDSIETAVAAAVAHGHDPSGRFRMADLWLRDCASERDSENVGETGPGSDDLLLAGPFASLPHPESWTEWVPIAGASGKQTLVVLRQDALWGVSCFLTGVLLLVWWWARRHGVRLCYAVTLCWLVAGVLGLLWLPTALRVVFCWPLVAGIALAAGWYLVSALRSRKPPLATELSAAASGVLALALAAGLPGQAAAPAPTIVWLLPGPSKAPNDLNALVPPELLSRLKALAHRGAAGLQSPVLLAANYEGTVLHGSADFHALFQIYCFTDERAALALPLAGVELQEAFLDGGAAYPALAAPQTGFGITLEGRGTHRVRVHFRARVTSTGEDREIRFSIPEVAQSQLAFIGPATAHYLRAVSARGAQQVRAEPKAARLEADLGRGTTLSIRWRQEPEKPPPLSAKVTEAWYWDLQRSGSRLLGLLEYNLNRGALPELTVLLPENMEVRQVELVSPGAGGSWPRLKDWTVSGTGSERRLRLEFQVPVTNQVHVLLELVPRLPLTHHAVLHLPTTLGVAFGEGWLAFRASGLSCSIALERGLEEIEPGLFERHWEPAGTEYPGLPERAYHFVHASAGMPALQLDLGPPAPRRECLQDVTWFLGPERAELRAQAELKAPLADLALVAWEIPAEVSVADVHGPEIRNWSRTGSHLQVWLQRSTAETTLELTGWVRRPANQPTAVFQLPCIAIQGTAVHRTSLHLVPEKSWAVQAEKLHNLGELPETQPADHVLSLQTSESTYQGLLRLYPAPAPADLQSLSWLAVRDHRLAFHATLDYRIGRRTPRKLTVRLRNWKGESVHLDVPRAVRIREGRGVPQNRTWTLELPPAFTGRDPRRGADARKLTCQLTGTLTPDSNGEVTMPEVSVDEASNSDSWLATIGAGLRPEEQRGLVTVTDAARALGRWPSVADSLRHSGGSVWEMAASDWRLRLKTDFPLVEPSPARLLLEEQVAAVLDGRRWLHQATYWLYQGAGTHLGILLPKATTLMMASLDGNEITPLQAGSDRLWLPLTGSSGLQALRLRWVFSADRESLDRPRLEKPLFENITEQRGPTVWTVHIPPGYRLDHAGTGVSQTSQAELCLDRAAALFLAIELLAQHDPGRAEETQTPLLVTAQTQFDSCCREAEYELALPEQLREKAVHAQDLAPRLQKLRAENREFFRRHQLERIYRQAESQAASYPRAGYSPGGAGADRLAVADREHLLGRQGTPTYWKLDEDQGGVPELHLLAIQTEHRRQSLGYSGLLLILLLLACILPAYPRVLSWLWATWPEQLILLGGLIWLTRGANLAVALLVFWGVVARLVYLGRWIAARLRRPSPAAAGSGAPSGS